MYIVVGQDRGVFLGDAKDLTFFRVKFHAVGSFPCLECVEVSLEDTGVFYCLNGTIEEAIVCKQSDSCPFCQVFTNVVNIRQEK